MTEFGSDDNNRLSLSHQQPSTTVGTVTTNPKGLITTVYMCHLFHPRCHINTYATSGTRYIYQHFQDEIIVTVPRAQNTYLNYFKHR